MAIDGAVWGDRFVFGVQLMQSDRCLSRLASGDAFVIRWGAGAKHGHSGMRLPWRSAAITTAHGGVKISGDLPVTL